MTHTYARDASKKIKSVFQAKGRSGKHVASSPPYGYLKSPEDKNHWIVDEEAAAVIRRIFDMTLNGFGPYQICCILERDKVEIPAAHQQKLGIGLYKSRKLPNPYHWTSSSVVNILERREYLGHTVNFKTKKHFKDSHSTYVEKDEWVVFEDTQEPIIDEHTFELVQKLRQNVKRWPNGWGKAHPLAGLVFCADCGGKLYCHRTYNGKELDHFTCANYGKLPVKTYCQSPHRIEGDSLIQLVKNALKATSEYIQQDSGAFFEAVEDSINSQKSEEVKAKRKRLGECQRRMTELDRLLCKIYEDNALGKLSDKRYNYLSEQYEAEQAALEKEVAELQAEVSGYMDGTTSAKRFMSLMQKYQYFDEITTGMANELIDKIVVHERDRKGAIQTSQKVEIHFAFIGAFTPPKEEIDPEILAEQAEAKRKDEARRDKLHQNYLKRKAEGKTRADEERRRPKRKAILDAFREARENDPNKYGINKGEYLEQRAETSAKARAKAMGGQ